MLRITSHWDRQYPKHVGEKVIKEMNYLMREQEEQGRRTLPETGRSNPQQADESKREKAERKTVPKKSKSRKSWKTSVPHQGKYGLKKKLTVISSKCGQDINAKLENPSAISD